MNAAQLRKIRDGIVVTALDSTSEVDKGATAAARKIFDQLCRLPLAQELIPQDPANGNGYAANSRHDAASRVDSQTLAFFARELEYVYSEVEREEYADLPMAEGEIIPLDSSVPEGAETFSYYVYGAVGVARFMSGYASGSLPLVTIKGAKVTGNVEPMANGYAYDTRDARNAQHTGMPLEPELAFAARRGHEELLQRTGLWGRMDLGIPGLLNHPNIIQSTPGTSAGAGDDTWPNKTPDEIIADIVTLIDTVDEVTFGKEKVNAVRMSRARYNFIKTLRLGVGDGTLTVLKYVQEMYPEVKFGVLEELAGDHSDGNLPAGSHAMFAYTAGNKKKASLVVPMPFKQHPVQQDGLTFKVPCESSTGGVKMKSPLMCNMMEGI